MQLGASAAPQSDGQSSTGLVVFNSGSGDILLWIPALLCVWLMVAVMLFSPEPAGAGTVPAQQPSASNTPAASPTR